MNKNCNRRHRPKATTSEETVQFAPPALQKVGVGIDFGFASADLKCLVCDRNWEVELEDGILPVGYWLCPVGCNQETAPSQLRGHGSPNTTSIFAVHCQKCGGFQVMEVIKPFQCSKALCMPFSDGR